MKKFTLLKIFLGLLLLFLLYFKIGFADIVKEISKMNLILIPLILIVFFLSLVIAALNICLFTLALNYRIPLKRLFKFYLISWTSGLLVPGKLGEFVLVPLLKKEGVSLGEGLSIAFLDKLITVFSLAVISIVGLLLVFNLQQTAVMVILILLAIIILIILLVSDSFRSFIRKYILRKYEKNFIGFSKSFFRLLKNKVTIFNTALTTIKWVLAAITIWLLFLSLGANVNLIYIFFISSITTIISLIPITISGLGIREASAIYLYSLIGVQPLVVASVYIIFVGFNYIFGSIVFLVIPKQNN